MDVKERDEKQQYWTETIEQWRNSGESKAGFCRIRDLSECQFHYWYRRLNECAGFDGRGFSRVHTVEGSGIRFRSVTGLELDLDSNFDELTLKRVLSVLGSLC